MEEAYRELTAGMREDQLAALACLGELIQEVKASPEPLAFAVFWLGEADLLQDKQVTWISNIKTEGLRKIIRHAFRRICRDDPPNEESDPPV